MDKLNKLKILNVKMQSRVDIYFENPHGVYGQGVLRFSLNVNDATTLQTVAASIHKYIYDNAMLDYSTYNILLTGEIATFIGARQMNRGKDLIYLLVPNDIYVPEVSNLTIGDLPRLIPRIDLNSPVRAYIGDRFRVRIK